MVGLITPVYPKYFFLFKQVDKIVDQLLGYVWIYDLAGLQTFWEHLERRVFARLECSHAANVRKLEISLLRYVNKFLNPT